MPLPAEYVGHVPLMVGSFVGVVLLESVIPPLELPLVELLVDPPELPPELVLPPLLELPPLELLPPLLLEPLPELLVLLEVLELLEPLEPVCPLEELVFRPTSEPLLLPETVLLVLLVIGVGVLLPPELPEPPGVESPVLEAVPDAQPGAHAAPQSKTKRQGDSVRSNRFTATPSAEKRPPVRRTSATVFARLCARATRTMRIQVR